MSLERFSLEKISIPQDAWESVRTLAAKLLTIKMSGLYETQCRRGLHQSVDRFELESQSRRWVYETNVQSEAGATIERKLFSYPLHSKRPAKNPLFGAISLHGPTGPH